MEPAVLGVDIDGTVEFWSAQAEQLFGWKASEIIGQSVRTIHPEADAVNEFEEILKRCTEQGPQVLD